MLVPGATVALVRIGVLGGPCGPADPALSRAARAWGAELGRRCWGLVDGTTGPVGAELARSAALAGVDVIVVLARGAEPVDPGADCRRVADHSARTAAVRLLSDAVVVLPGGVDTLVPLLDLLTEHALELAGKPYGVLDPAGVLDPLGAQLDVLARRGELSVPLLRDSDPARLADRLTGWLPPGQRVVREEVAWVHPGQGMVSLVPGGAGLALPGGPRRPVESGRVALSRVLGDRWGLTVPTAALRLLVALAVPGVDGVLRRVSCYRTVGAAPELPGTVQRAVGDSAGCEAVAAALHAWLRP